MWRKISLFHRALIIAPTPWSLCLRKLCHRKIPKPSRVRRQENPTSASTAATPTAEPSTDEAMANFPVNPQAFLVAGLAVEHGWHRPARGRMALGGEPTREHEDYAIVSINPMPQEMPFLLRRILFLSTVRPIQSTLQLFLAPMCKNPTGKMNIMVQPQTSMSLVVIHTPNHFQFRKMRQMSMLKVPISPTSLLLSMNRNPMISMMTKTQLVVISHSLFILLLRLCFPEFPCVGTTGAELLADAAAGHLVWSAITTSFAVNQRISMSFRINLSQ
ncbi:hypothetical protein PVAP13_4KG115815 [Panicum virgatum]|uniref:DUF7597 domain-containing protein n=1 Tax=Panicum virgatum TaxID=38727 RepID=A0A8T0TQK6_PANVG|nr:hypothetical protein PVAP13_4KG115815 [Panicum virgatum]